MSERKENFRHFRKQLAVRCKEEKVIRIVGNNNITIDDESMRDFTRDREAMTRYTKTGRCNFIEPGLITRRMRLEVSR